MFQPKCDPHLLQALVTLQLVHRRMNRLIDRSTGDREAQATYASALDNIEEALFDLTALFSSRNERLLNEIGEIE